MCMFASFVGSNMKALFFLGWGRQLVPIAGHPFCALKSLKSVTLCCNGERHRSGLSREILYESQNMNSKLVKTIGFENIHTYVGLSKATDKVMCLLSINTFFSFLLLLNLIFTKKKFLGKRNSQITAAVTW